MRGETSPGTLATAEARRFLRFLGLEAIELYGKLDAESERFILETAAETRADMGRER
jgi:hypothetical protein